MLYILINHNFISLLFDMYMYIINYTNMLFPIQAMEINIGYFFPLSVSSYCPLFRFSFISVIPMSISRNVRTTGLIIVLVALAMLVLPDKKQEHTDRCYYLNIKCIFVNLSKECFSFSINRQVCLKVPGAIKSS